MKEGKILADITSHTHANKLELIPLECNFDNVTMSVSDPEESELMKCIYL